MADIVITPASNDVNSTAGTLVIRTSDAQAMSLKTNDTDRIFIASAGKVGIGTATNISGVLHVHSPDAGNQTLLVLHHSAGYSTNTENRLDFFDDETHKIAARISQYYSNETNNRWGLKFYTNSDTAINSVPALTLLGRNAVGIGTANPNGMFHVHCTQNGSGEVYFTSNTGNTNQNNDSPKLILAGEYQTAGVSLQAVNTAAYGRKDLVILQHDANDYVTAYEAMRLSYGGTLTLNTTNKDINVLNLVSPSSATLSNNPVLDISRGGGAHKGSAIRVTSANYTDPNKQAFIELNAAAYGGANTRFINCFDDSRQSFVVLANARVGIGTASPGAALEVSGSAIIGSSTYGASYGHSLRIPFSADNLTAGTLRGHLQFDSIEDYSVNAGDAWKWKLGAVARPGNAGNYNSQFEILRSTRVGVTDNPDFVINRDGNIGIGMISPNNKIQISGGGISFTTSTGLAVPMIGIVLPTNIAFIGPYNSPADGNSPTVVALNHARSVEQTWFYASGTIAMSLNRQGRFHIGDLNNAPNCLLSVGPSSSTTAVSGMCFGNDASANLYRSAASTIKTDGSLSVIGSVKIGSDYNSSRLLQVKDGLVIGSSFYTFASIDVSSTGDLILTANANPANLGANTNIIFKHGTSAGGGPLERMRIVGDGNVGIGTTSPGALLDVNGIAIIQYEEGQNQYSFRGANRAINDWDYNGLFTNPTYSSYLDGSWYIDSAGYNDWDRGLLSKRRFRRVEGLTLEYESFTQDNDTGGVYVMIGFVGGNSVSATYYQTPANLTYQAINTLVVYTNGGSSGADYTFDTRNAWWRFKTVLKGTGALHYVYRDNKWNLIKETSTNNQNDYEYLRVVVSLYRQRVYLRDVKVYVAQGSFRGSNYIDNVTGNLFVNGSVGIGTTSPTTKLAVSDGTTVAQVNPDGGVAYFGTVNNYPMVLSVNSSEKVRITSAGLVSIGTSSALAQFHVTGQTYLTNVVANVARNQLTINTNGANYAHFYDAGVAANNALSIGGNGAIATVPTKAIMTWRLSTENVGIGLTNPEAASALHIKNTDAVAKVTIESADASESFINFSAQSSEYSVGFVRDGSNVNSLRFCAADGLSAGEVMRLQNTNVGIGTTVPAYRLDTEGASTTSVVQNVRNPSTAWTQYALTRYQTDTKDSRYVDVGYFRGAGNEATRGFVISGLSSNILTLLDVAGGYHLGLGGVTAPLFNIDVASTQGKGIQLRYDTTAGYLAQITPYWSSNTDTRIDFAINRVANVTPSVIMSVGYASNVGIGTTSPTQKLDIVGSYGAPDDDGGMLKIRGPGVGPTQLNFGVSADGGYGWIQATDIAVDNDRDIILAPLGGNVGIGTTSPSSKLHVYDNGGSFRTDLDSTYHMGMLNEYVSTYVSRTKFGRWNSTSNLELYYDIANTEEARITRNLSTAVLKFNRSTTTDMIIDGNGRVGIGTASPTTLLSVGGAGSTLPASGITFGADASANLYRAGSSAIRTDGALIVGSYIRGLSYIQLLTNIYADSFTDTLNINIGNTAANNWETAIKIKPGSYVGIGTTNPTGKLHIVSTIAGETVLRADGTNGTLFSVVDDLSDSLMSVNNSAGLPVLEVFADDRIIMGQYGSGDLVLRNNKVGIGTTNAVNKLSVIGSASIGSSTYNIAAPSNGLIVEGNVGIGTTNPSYKLDVSASATNVGRFYNNQSTLILNIGSTNNTEYTDLQLLTDNGNAQFFKQSNSASWGGVNSLNIYTSNGAIAFHPAGNGNAVYIDSNTNVGINKTSPTTKLDVVGSFRVVGTTNVGGIFITGTSASQGNIRPAVNNGTVLISDDSGSSTRGLTVSNGGGAIISSISNSYDILTLQINGTTNHIFDRDGNVGIGLTAPNAARLHIKGNGSDPVLRVESASLVAGTSTASKTFVSWLPIMTGAAGTDKVFIPLFKN